MIDMNQVGFQYAGCKIDTGIHNVKVKIKKGECVLLCGESGCGKTTILKFINGLIPYFEKGKMDGDILIQGKNTRDMQQYDISDYVSCVFQNPKTQFFNTDVESEITFALENKGMKVEDINRRLEETVRELHLEKLRNRSMFELSGGQKQLIAFASAYISDTPVIVLDEPSANLDYEATNLICDVIRKLKEKGKTIVIAEHRISYLKEFVDTVYYVNRGEITKCYSGKDFYMISNLERKQMGLRTLKEFHVRPVLAEQKHTKSPWSIEVQDLELAYKKKVIFRSLDFKAESGDIIGIIGENGVGKSTFLRTIAGLHKYNKGLILINGKEVTDKKRQKLCGMVMQDVNYQLFTNSVKNECMLGSKGFTEDRCTDLFQKTGLNGFEDRHPQSLSGGQKQRLAMASVYASEKKIVLLDEPTSGLDYKNMIAVGEILRKMADYGDIILIVTHDMEFVETVCNRIFQLEN